MKRIWLTIFLLLSTHVVSADTIYLKNGRQVNGRIIHQTPVYVRLEARFLGDPEREFLVENIDRIEFNNVYDRYEYPETEFIAAEDVITYVSDPSLAQVPDNVQQAAREMAAALLEQAMREVEIPTIDNAPENVKRAAEQRATDILEQAMSTLNETPESVKGKAREIATSLLEESVREAAISSIDQVPQDVKAAANQKASALIEQAMIDSVQNAPDQVKVAAEQKARTLIEDAVREVKMTDALLEQAKQQSQSETQDQGPGFMNVVREMPVDKVQAVMEDTVNQDVTEVASQDAQPTGQIKQQLDQVKDQGIEVPGPPIINVEREFSSEKVRAVMQEAVNRRINESATRVTKPVRQAKNTVQRSSQKDDISLFEERVIEQERIKKQVAKTSVKPDPVEEQKVPDKAENVETPAAAEIPVKVQESPDNFSDISVQKFISIMMDLGYKDYVIMGLCVLLLLVLLNYRGKSKPEKHGDAHDHDLQVLSTITFQNLPDDIKSKFTSSDISLILELDEQYHADMEKSGSGEVIIEHDQLAGYVQTKAAESGARFALEDIKRVLEVKEKAALEAGLA